jgi:pilus assembly protein FimV
MYRKLASAVLVASAINAQYALAVGLGGMTMHSALNQPLDAEIAISSAGDLDKSQILIGLASQEEFLKSGVDRAFFLSDITFDVILDGKGGGVVKLRSTKRLNEPYLDFLLEAKWPTGRMLRSYTALVDLPVYSEPEVSPVDLGKTQQVSTPQVAPQPESIDAKRPQIQSLRPSSPAEIPGYIKPKASVPQTVTQTAGFSGSEYTIQANDTLSKIAGKLKPNSQVTLNQTMIAIQKMNPHAFVRNNINMIKAGAVLRVPTEADVSQVSASAASQAVIEQTREWRGVQLEATESKSTLASKPKPSADEGHLSLTSAGSGLANGKESAADTSGLSQKLNATKESLQVSNLENKELGSKVDSLNTQVNQLKRMIELKDAELAALQKKLGKEPVKSAKEEVAAAKPEATKPKQADEKTSEAKVAEPTVQSLPEQQAEVEVVKEKPAEKPVKPKKPEPEKPVKPVEEPVVEKTLLEKIQAKALYLGVFALVLIFGVVAFIFRRKAQAERQAMQDNDISNFDFDQAVGESSLDSLGSNEIAENFDSGSQAETDLAEEHAFDDGQETVMQTSDPIGEADIYIAYGRYDQAAELLLNAIAASPNNADLRTKLLEVYIESKNKAGFQQQYMELRSLGKAAVISHAKELLTTTDGVADWLNDLPADEGSAISHDNAFDADDNAVAQDFDLDMNDDAESGFSFKEEKPIVSAELAVDENDFDLDLSDMDLEDSSDLDFDSPASTAAVEPELAEPELEDSDFGSDLSLDLSDLDLDAETNVSAAALGKNDDLSSDMDELSFDLSDEFDEKPAVAVVSEEDFADLSSSDEVLDFDFEDVSTPPDAEVANEILDEDFSMDSFDLDMTEEPAKPDVLEEDALDFSDVDLGLNETGLVSAEPTILRDAIDFSLVEDEPPMDDLSATESAYEFDSGFEEVATELEEVTAEEITESVPVTPAVVEPHISAPIAALESEDLEFLTDGDEVSTKLDLAQAYVDLGDVDGARDILLEVMKEGKEEQKAEAAALLDSLD